MRASTFLMALAAGGFLLPACGDDNTDDIFDRLVESQEELAEARKAFIQDIEWPVGISLTGDYSVDSTTRHYRWVEGSAPVEQYTHNLGSDANETRTETMTSGGERMETILGKGKIFDGLPTNINTTPVTTIAYFVEAWYTAADTVSETVVVQGSTTNTYTESIDTFDAHGMLKYYIQENMTWQMPSTRAINVECIDGDIWPLTQASAPCDSFSGTNWFYGLKNVAVGEMWDHQGSIYQAVTNETLSVNVDGETTDVTTVRVDVWQISEQDPGDQIVEQCVADLTTEDPAGSGTELSTFNCPGMIVSASMWWYNNMLVQFDMTSVDISLDADTVVNGTDDADDSAGVATDFDPGLGFELIESCDRDDDGENETCRYFSDSNRDTAVTVTSGINSETVDFSDRQGALSRYAHFEVMESTTSWTVTDIESADDGAEGDDSEEGEDGEDA